MSKKKADAPPKGRRPKRVAEKLEQFSIRLPAKLKFGLEMLARAQHRSMTQSLEWALQVGLNSYAIGRPDEGTLGDIVDQVWVLEAEPARLMRLFQMAPTLLTFDESATCELIHHSQELLKVRSQLQDWEGGTAIPEEAKKVAGLVRELHYKALALYQLAEENWTALHSIATGTANAGRTVKNISIVHALGKSGARRLDEILRESLDANKGNEAK